MTYLRAAIVTAMLSTACVSTAKYDAVLEDARKTKAEMERLRAEGEQQKQAGAVQLDKINADLQAARTALQENENQLSQSNVQSHNLQAKLDESTAIGQRLREELQRLGKNVDGLLSEKGTMSHALEDAKQRLEELRKAQAATEARTALYKQLIQKFKKLTDAGQLRIELRDGRMILQLPNDVLFDSGQAAVKPDGQRAIGQVAGVLKTLGGRKFQVAGHTDNVPIDRAKFASNWELSTARAVAVVRYLVSQGVASEALSAAGYGEFAPLVANDTAEHKAKNRRIEISLVPAMDELVNLPDVK
ncbi:MAG TPA: OmpA family protein [Polyangiaceae bacterium]|jgi:chemotaxis protein MotB|nr:OmpA family protein [Polyangiaceae bacterium]